MSERSTGPEQDLPHRGRLVATYERPGDARRAMDEARRAGFEAVPGHAVDRRGALRGEMADELESTVVGPGSVGPFTKSMSKGLARWVPLGTVLGVIGGALLGLLPWPGGLDVVPRLILGGVTGGSAGEPVGFPPGGFVRPERRHEDERPLEAEAGSIVAGPGGGPPENRRGRAGGGGGGPGRGD